MKRIFSEDWDEANQEWFKPKINSKTKIKNYIKSLIGLPVYNFQLPNSENLHHLINEIKVDKNPLNSITTLSFHTTEPSKGLFLLQNLHNNADNICPLLQVAVASAQSTHPGVPSPDRSYKCWLSAPVCCCQAQPAQSLLSPARRLRR